MSMKPCKKSDSKKKWMSDCRDRRITIAPEYHLIDARHYRKIAVLSFITLYGLMNVLNTGFYCILWRWIRHLTEMSIIPS